MKLTIVIPSFLPEEHEKTGKCLPLCLDSLDGHNVVVAYHGDGTKLPQGQCKAVNDAASRIDTEWLMVMNNDMIAPPGWFEEMLYWIDKLGLLVASPNLMEPDRGAPPFIVKDCGGVGNFDKQCFLDFAENYKPVEQSNYDGKVPIEDGFNLPFIIRKDVWDTVGGYDENYDPWGSNSDSDLQYKIMLAGITPKRIKSVLFYHFSQVSGTFLPENKEYWRKNYQYFTDKWGFKRPRGADPWYKPDIEWDNLIYHPEWEGKYA